jgi:PAS domain S-box-containing protein
MATAGATGLVSAAVLAGWVLDWPVLTQVVPGWPAMVPATATGLLLAAASLLVLAGRASGDPARAGRALRFVQVCAAAAALMGMARLLELASGAAWQVAFLGMAGPASDTMPVATAGSLVLLGAALLLGARARLPRLAQALCLLTLLAAWLGLSRYIYGVAPPPTLSGMAFHTAVLVGTLSIGILSIGTPVGLIGLLGSGGEGGASARYLLPAAILLPLALTWLPLAPANAGWFGQAEALAVSALSMTLVFGALIWVHAARLEHSRRLRQEALDALSSGEERLRLIIEGALDAVVTIDRDGHITGWNSVAESAFGWSRDEALGRELGELIVPPRYVAAHRAGLRRFLETSESRVLNRRVELSAMHRSGREFPIEIAITPLRTSEGIAFCAFVRDITRRREVHAALEASEARFRTLAESLPNLVWTCRSDGWCDFLSRQWVEYTGRPESEQLGSGWAEQLHAADRDRVQALWASAVGRGERFDTEFRIRRYDGT